MSVSVPLPDVVARFMAGAQCAEPGVVAVSGGPDSVALLRALLALWPERKLVVAHLNHALRGAESDGDATFVRALHVALPNRALLLRHTRIDVAACPRAPGESLETIARRLRYEWLIEVAREVGATWIATGHTADDQAETVLHRCLRGTGLKGLCGIPAWRELAPGIQLVRPLLGVRRQEVLAYLASLEQDYREDSSNADVAFTRNRIRLELLPHLAAVYNPGIVTALCRLAAQASAIQEEEERRAAVLLHDAELPRAGFVLVFDAAVLARASRHLVREMFRLVWTREGWPQGSVGFDDWDRIAAFVDDEEGTKAEVAGGIQVRRRGRVIQLERVP